MPVEAYHPLLDPKLSAKNRPSSTIGVLPLNLPYLVRIGQKSIDTGGVEVLAFLGDEVGEPVVDGPGMFVGPLADQRVEHVRHGDDAGDDRDVLTMHSRRVA